MGRVKEESASCGLVYWIKFPELVLQELVTNVGKSDCTMAFSWMVVCFCKRHLFCLALVGHHIMLCHFAGSQGK